MRRSPNFEIQCNPVDLAAVGLTKQGRSKRLVISYCDAGHDKLEDAGGTEASNLSIKYKIFGRYYA